MQLDVPEEDVPNEQQRDTSFGSASGEPTSVKRKQTGDGTEPGLPPKRRKKATSEDQEAVINSTKKEKERTHRYVLFVGNLLYTTTRESIQAHFETVCRDIITVRLLNHKTTNAGEPNKSKGYAFIEFSSSQSLQHALHLHHSQLDGRKINVELTAGGGGSGEKRRNALKARNESLEGERKEMRTKKSQANAMTDEDTSKTLPSAGSKPEGVSLASSMTQNVRVDKTKARRGGGMHLKRSAKNLNPRMASGANAVPMG